MTETDDTDQSTQDDSQQEQTPNPPKRLTDGGRTINRRQYLTYTGAVAGISAVASRDGQAASGRRGGAEASIDDNFGPDRLRVEYDREPNNLAPYDGDGSNGFQTAAPRFSWDVAGPRGIEQAAYRILVASSPDSLEDSQGDVWDSGMVEAARSINILYDGEPLEPDATYYWTVRVWDSDGNESKWGEPVRFTTAIPHTDEHWEGEWIGPEYEDNELPGSDWTDYTFEIEFTLVANTVGFLFRATDDGNFYMWQVNTVEEPYPVLRPHVRENGVWTVLDQIDIADSFDGEGAVHQLTIDVDGDEITTYLDDTQVDIRPDGTHDTGTIGFRTDLTEHAKVHSVRVTDPEGKLLFEDNFDLSVENFDGGTIQDGTLDLNGTSVVLRDSGFDRPGPLLRREFDLEKEVEKARAHVSGLGFYELYLNGERVGDRVLDPGRTNYEETILYSTYDVTDNLQDGTNAIGAALGRGRYGELVENTFQWNEAPWWSDPELRLQVNVQFDDGTATSITSDEQWTVTDGPTRFDSLYSGEIYDAREEKSGWTTPGYNDDDWDSPTVSNGPDGEMRPQQLPPIEVVDTVQPVTLEEPEPGVYVYDLGQMIAGWPKLTVKGTTDGEIKLSMGEKLYDDGTVNNENVHIPGDMQENRYLFDGRDGETWEPRFTYHGFRYVQIEGFPGEPSLDTIEGKVVHSTIDDGIESDFSCSNELLNQIHTNTRQAILNNSHSVPEDTPAREKNAYGADAQVVAEASIYNFSMQRFYNKWVQDWSDSQRADGELPTTAPNAGEWTYEQGGFTTPGWGSAYVLIPWWLYQYYEDRRLLEEHYESMKSYVQHMGKQADGYIITSGLGDWNAPEGSAAPPEGPAITSTSYYYRNSEILSNVANLLGKDEEATEFTELNENIKQSFNDEFFDREMNVYRTGEVDEYRQTSNVVPLAFDLVPDGHHEAVVQNLVQDIEETHDGHLNTGCIGTKYLLQVLTESGHHELAYTVATQTTSPSWGFWIEEVDATSLFERWDTSPGVISRNHQYLGSIDEWFYQYIAGIREPTEPGFAHVEVSPTIVEDLEWAEAETETVRGTVASRWERVETPGNGRDRGGLSLEVTIPGNSTATVDVPTLSEDAVRVRESEKTIWNNGNRTRPDHPGVEDVTREDDHVVVEVGAGEYNFELEQLGNQ